MSLFLEGKLVLEVNDPRRCHWKGLRLLNLGTRRFPVCVCLIRDFFVSLEMRSIPDHDNLSRFHSGGSSFWALVRFLASSEPTGAERALPLPLS